MKQQLFLSVFFIAFTASASFGQWEQNGTTKIWTNDSVGIKTNNPVAALDVNGAIHSSGSTILYNGTPTGTGDAFAMGWTNDFLNVSGRDYLLFKKIDVNDPTPDGGIAFLNHGTVGGEKVSLLINGTGNVGINTSAPDVKLHVNGDARIGGFLRVGGNTDGSVWKMGVSGDIITRNGNVVLGAATTDKIGIGITTPDVKLHVNGDARVGGFLRVGGNTDGSVWKMGVSGHIITRNGNVVLGAAATDKIGIGTTTPDVKLHVNGDARVGGFLRVGGNTDGNAWKMGISGNIITRNGNVALGVAASDKIGIGTTDPLTKLHLRNGDLRLDQGGQFFDFRVSTAGDLILERNGNATAMIIGDAAGNVGIGGTYSSTYKLKIYGSGYATGVWLSSDKRFKENIQTLDNALDKVMALRGTAYSFRTEDFKHMNFNSGKQIGFVAQELQSVLPELVKEDNGYLAVNYDGVVPVLVEAMKEQQAQIEEKDDAIAALESQVNNLEARLAKLEQLLVQNAPAGRSQSDTNGAYLKKAEDIRVFPNPNKGNFTVCFQPIEAGKKAVVLVLDMMGREVASQTIENGATQVEFNLRNEPAGTYIFQMVVDGATVASGNILLAK